MDIEHINQLDEPYLHTAVQIKDSDIDLLVTLYLRLFIISDQAPNTCIHLIDGLRELIERTQGDLDVRF